MNWLERAADDRSLNAFVEPSPLMAEVLDSLRGDRRVDALRRRLGID